MHLVALGEAGGAAQQLAQRAPWQFRSVTLAGDRGKFEPAVSLALWDRTCTVFGDAVPLPLPPELQARSPRAKVVHRPLPAAEQLPAALAEHLAALQQAREPDGAAAEVARTLDDFHDAADKGDADRYFAIFPPDAVFLGTDGTERWDGLQFQAFALPYFRRGSAWTFVPVVRHVTVGAGGQFAWFDERLDNEAYGECRGSGVLERRGGRWVVRLYDLTIPVPNDLAKALVARVRAFAQGRGDPATTVVVVRHAEKGDGDDPDLTQAGRARAERLAAVLAG
ncbi:MAG: hypothetical protein FJ265_22835, partial [Planctomycetes bacterium]|nr:hypothetical protein [Planctomycetota bacterium]